MVCVEWLFRLAFGGDPCLEIPCGWTPEDLDPGGSAYARIRHALWDFYRRVDMADALCGEVLGRRSDYEDASEFLFCCSCQPVYIVVGA